MEFVSFIDTRKGKKLLKVFKSQRAANMFLKKNMDNILSKSGVDSIGSMSKKEWDTKEAKYAIEGFSSDAQRKAAFANGYEEKDKKNEGKKRFKRQDGIGKAKYTISYHDGKKKHKDGSDFFDIKIFKNKKDLSDFVGTLAKQGYKLTTESVNEGKYNYKADALTAYFKGKIDAKELDKIARDDFKSGIATKKELSNFLSNKFTQDVMSDTYGIPAGTLIKRVRGLMKFAESIGESKKEVIAFRKKAKSETAFYDILDKIERKYGRGVFEKWLDKSLKDLKLNPKKYKTSADKQEALFQAKL